MKPTIADFEFAYCGVWYDEDYNDNWKKPNERHRLIDTQADYPTGEDYQELIILHDTEDNEYWGLEVDHDSWNEESFLGKGVRDDDIGRVEQRPITETRWVFE
jgi:hypothetical protein